MGESFHQVSTSVLGSFQKDSEQHPSQRGDVRIKWAKMHTVFRKVPGTQWVSTKEGLQLRHLHPGLSQRPLECPWDLSLAHISSQLTACPLSPHGRGEGCAHPQSRHLTHSGSIRSQTKLTGLTECVEPFGKSCLPASLAFLLLGYHTSRV